MPTLTGTSTGGFQIVGNNLVLTAPRFEILFDEPRDNEPKQFGYFYVLANRAFTPFTGFILLRGVVSTPGVSAIFPAVYGFATTRYSFSVRWRVENKAWSLIYV